MRKLRILQGVLKRTGARRLLASYLVFVFFDALFIQMVEPGIESYGDALWYCYAVLSTAGFGDIIVTTTAGRLASALLTVYSLFALAIITGVVVNFFTQLIQIRQRATLAAFADKLERLPELSPEELAELAQDIADLRETLPDK